MRGNVWHNVSENKVYYRNVDSVRAEFAQCLHSFTHIVRSFKRGNSFNISKFSPRHATPRTVHALPTTLVHEDFIHWHAKVRAIIIDTPLRYQKSCKRQGSITLKPCQYNHDMFYCITHVILISCIII